MLRTKNLFAPLLAAVCLLSLRLTIVQAAPEPAPPKNWFNTLVAHWTDYGDPDYLAFLQEARPDVAQVGFYGCTFYSLAHTPFGSGYPAHLPVQGTKECGQFFENLNRQIHKRKIKVVGHFNVGFLFGDPEKKTGFFEWYEKGWNEKEMGKKPVADPLELLEKDAAGKPVTSGSYSIGGWPEYHACLNNPQWRAVMKAMVKVAIKRGVDGLIANYFYRHDCLCHYCQEGFRGYLGQHYTSAQLRDMGIDNLATYQFTEIPSWHDPAKTNAYRMAALTWTQISMKAAFDDVFIAYARKLKPGFMAAQWNHLGNFGQIAGDERCALPGDLWGRGEDYLWYSTGDAAHQTDLKNHFLGDGTLQLRYIRGAFGPKPYLLGKYESTRTRVTIAEGVANGGASLGFYAPFKDPAGREALTSYFQFIRKNREIYQGAQTGAEMVLLYPRSAVHKGDITPVERFRQLGQFLIHEGFAFDVVPDDLLGSDSLRTYKAVAVCDESALTSTARQALDAFSGERIAMLSTELPADSGEWVKKQLSGVSIRRGSSRVVFSLMAQPKEKRLLVHLVNYDRQEPLAGISPSGRGPKDECPIPAPSITVKLQIPEGSKVRAIRILSPDESPHSPPLEIDWKNTRGGAVEFSMPQILVYSVAVVQLDWK